MTRTKRVPGRKRGKVVPRALPAPVPTRTLQRARRAATRTHTKAKELASQQLGVTHLGAGVAGMGASLVTSGVLADADWLDWLSPEWQSVVLTGLGATASYVAYRYDKPHLAWGFGGWAAGSAYFGAASALSRREYEKEVKKLAEASGDQPRNALEDFDADDYDHAREAELTELAEERIRDLEDALAEARAQLTPEMELAAA